MNAQCHDVVTKLIPNTFRKGHRTHFSSPKWKLSPCQSLKSPRELNELTNRERLSLRVFIFLGKFAFLCSRGRNVCVDCAGTNEPTFPFLPGGFIAIAVGDGEKLMELPQRRSQLKPQPSQQVTPSTSPNIKDLGEKWLWVGFAEKFPSYHVVFPGRSQWTFVVISEGKRFCGAEKGRTKFGSIRVLLYDFSRLGRVGMNS